jgi:glutamate-1-semialdehyde 2,1-aminomutase
MQAVRLARYHTRRSHLVRFAGSYHGWWGDVQPGVGNPVSPHETYTLADMSERTLHVLRTRRDIACVLVNPLQALHPNANAPSDSSLVDSSRGGHCDRTAYGDWLKKLREVCTERGIVLIFDEVFVGFRLARGGAQEYFGVKADMVTYGKSLAGGLPIGVVCGRKELMRRFRDDRPADVCFARGTFNSHARISARSTTASTSSGTSGRASSTTCWPRKACPFRSPTCRRSGWCITPSRPATIGCCNIICAPRGLP